MASCGHNVPGTFVRFQTKRNFQIIQQSLSDQANWRRSIMVDGLMVNSIDVEVSYSLNDAGTGQNDPCDLSDDPLRSL